MNCHWVFLKKLSLNLIWNLFLLQLYHGCVFIMHSEIFHPHFLFFFFIFYVIFLYFLCVRLCVSLANKSYFQQNGRKQKTGVFQWTYLYQIGDYWVLLNFMQYFLLNWKTQTQSKQYQGKTGFFFFSFLHTSKY